MKNGITWDFNKKWFRTYGQIWHLSPVDSSFTYIRIFFEMGRFWSFPIVCVSGYQPNAGVKLRLFHRTVFDNTLKARRALAKKEGFTLPEDEP